MNIVSMALAFVEMPDCINPALLSFVWGREANKNVAAEKIKAGLAKYAGEISKEDQDAWAQFIVQVIELDTVLCIGLVTLVKDNIREVYADMFEGYGKFNLDWVADWITTLTEIELRNRKVQIKEQR